MRRVGGGVRFLPLPPEQVGSRSDHGHNYVFFLHSNVLVYFGGDGVIPSQSGKVLDEHYVLVFLHSNVLLHLNLARYWMRYRLPEGVSCALCILQWRYWAGNSWGR